MSRKAKRKKHRTQNWPSYCKTTNKEEALFHLMTGNEALQKENEKLINALMLLDKINIEHSDFARTYTETMEQFTNSVNLLIKKNIRNNSIDDFFRGWSANVRYLSHICNETEAEARSKIPFIKRGNIVKAHFGWTVGSELRYEHFAVVVEKLKNRNPDHIMVVPLVSYKNIHEQSIEEPDIYLGVIKSLNKGKQAWSRVPSVAKISQMRTIDKLRIIYPKKSESMSTIDENQLSQIDEMIKKWFTKN